MRVIIDIARGLLSCAPAGAARLTCDAQPGCSRAWCRWPGRASQSAKSSRFYLSAHSPRGGPSAAHHHSELWIQGPENHDEMTQLAEFRFEVGR